MAWINWNPATYYWWWGGGAYWCSTYSQASCAWWDWCQWIVILRYKTDWSCWISNQSRWWTKTTCWDYTIHTFTDTSWTLQFIPVFK
jgi:hypothetical protein